MEEFFVKPKVQVAFVGDVVQIHCKISENWRKEGSTMPPAYILNNTLYMFNVSLAHTGIYTCFTTEENSFSAEVLVGGMPISISIYL